MKSKMLSLFGSMMIGLGLVGVPASWANSLTYQGVTFDMSVNGSGELVVEMSGTGTGNWTGVNGLESFAINNYGTASGLSLDGQPTGFSGSTSFSIMSGGLNANGCDGTGNFVCIFQNPPASFSTNPFDVVFTLKASSGSFNLNLADGDSGLFGPHLKVCFSTGTAFCTGDLLSQTVPGTSVPEPASLMLLGAGLAGLGIWRRKLA